MSENNLYWGDIHAHTGFSPCYWPDQGEGKIDDFYRYARDESKLDFCAATDHDSAMDSEQWKRTLEAAAHWNENDRFVTFPAYEWTNWNYGHQCVYLQHENPPLFRCTPEGKPDGRHKHPKVFTPDDLWTALAQTGMDAITIPHHPANSQFPVDWNYHNPKFQRLVEISSLWGNYEYNGNECPSRLADKLPGRFVQDALFKAYRLGFVAGSESHDIRPGNYSFGGRWKALGTPEITNPLGRANANHIGGDTANSRGLMAVYSPSKTREDIFKAMYERRCYGTTGARIELDFRLDGNLMGEELSWLEIDKPRKIKVKVKGSSNIENISIIRNGELIKSVDFPQSNNLTFDFSDSDDLRKNLLITPFGLRNCCYYYLRVKQVDGHFAWSSPIWLDFPLASSNGDESAGVEIETNGLVKIIQSNGEINSGTSVWLEKREPGYSHLFVRWRNQEFSVPGALKIEGAAKYFLDTINFQTTRISGELATDDNLGGIRWHTAKSSDLKGLDIVIFHKGQKCEVTFK